ncbi:heterokaryon incompatibility protein-domain-containing protein [Astrocystis sublimbata]|nr:heterokaryon incompatibility protein-domain-containing protein [Astrocystis sublimbata]
MRLLNVRTFGLEEFLGSDIPRYSILSHRWEDEEVTFQDLTSDRHSDMQGWKKILGCCTISRHEGFRYTWIDSCCIDKSSSAELSESVNSMFRWYKDAAVCYAYLSDVQSIPDLPASTWFSRGWTLQELIAPDSVVFLNADWQEIGTKVSLIRSISEITGIDHEILGTARPRRDINESLRTLSTAKKLSWAATRVTTRIEDMSYCLLGLLDVHMPLIYGEGDRAFRRLQEQIMNTTDDDSIFAWSPYSEDHSGSIAGVLADSPRCFAGMNGITLGSRHSAGHSSLFEISKGFVKLWVSIPGPSSRPHGLVRDLLDNHSLSLIRRVSDPGQSLTSIIRNDYPGDRQVLNTRVRILQCRAEFGRVVLLLKTDPDNAFLRCRYHFDGHLYFLQDMNGPLDAEGNIGQLNEEILPVVLVRSPTFEESLVPNFPPVRLHSRVRRLGYRMWATSTPNVSDKTQKATYWLRARDGRGYLLFENIRHPDWPSFLLLYQYERRGNHLGVHCGLVAKDFMPEDAAKALRVTAFQSSRNLSQLRVQLPTGRHLVAKVRVKTDCCDIVLLVQ